MKKIELLQSVKVLALNIQKHLKLRGGKFKKKKKKEKRKEKKEKKKKRTESGLLPPTVALLHLVFRNIHTA